MAPTTAPHIKAYQALLLSNQVAYIAKDVIIQLDIKYFIIIYFQVDKFFCPSYSS